MQSIAVNTNQRIIKTASTTMLLMLLLLLSKTASSDYPIAPEFLLPTENKPIQLSKLRGKVVYIDFWASWCRPCKNSFPWMINIKEKFKDKPFEIIAINLDKDKALADQFIKSQAINFPVAFDPEAKIAEKYAVEGMPSSYLIDAKGHMRIRYTGFWNKSKNEKEKAINNLLLKMKTSSGKTVLVEDE
jgi:thiol-disulfide isomerase/thioredoxin